MGVAEDEFFTLGVPEPGHRSEEERTFQRDISQINEKDHTQTQIGPKRKPPGKNTNILPKFCQHFANKTNKNDDTFTKYGNNST